MNNSDFWTTVRGRQHTPGRPVRTGALRAALLFGTVAIAVATIVVPLLSSNGNQNVAFRNAAYDAIATGSIHPAAATRIYTVRRSITQPIPEALCIIDGAGHHEGEC